MATIDTGSGAFGKKAVDANIPLIPFIDLLLCCIMFLLVTAVWNELASIDALQNTPGQTAHDRVAETTIQLEVQLTEHGYVVSSTAGDSVAIPRIGSALDHEGLGERLDLYRKTYPQQHAITIAPDDGIPFEAVVATMDTVRAQGFSAITL